MDMELKELPVPLPPNLLQLMGYPANARYVALYYLGSKATWNDGLASATFSYYSTYRPLVEHPAIAIHLMGMHLGSDDRYPTHALVCDRRENKLSAGEMDHVHQLIGSQFATEPDADVISRYRGIFREPQTLGEMQDLGMFEAVFGPNPQQQGATESLLGWLDRYITEELVGQYTEMLKNEGIALALPALSYFRERFRGKPKP